MDSLGLLTLGAFVGAIAALGVRYIHSVESWQKALFAILPAVLSGVAISLVERFQYSPALGCYPLGLIVAFMWTYSDVAVRNIAQLPTDPTTPQTGGFPGQRAIGVLPLLASTLVTRAAIAIVLPPTIAQGSAEWIINTEAHVKSFLEQRQFALTAGEAKGTHAATSPQKSTDHAALAVAK